MKQALSESSIQENLDILNQQADSHWELKDGKLSKEFVFGNFIEAFSWMTKVAIFAEKSDHHPEWFNVYNKVKVELQTHDANGITELDFLLANQMEASQ